MYERELEAVGLSPNEARIYETLLRLGQSGVSEIALKSNVHRRSVYDTLMRLIEKGLVFQIFQGKENLYQAVDPHKCMELLREKEETFAKALPGLEYFYNEEPAREAAFIYRGIEGYKNYVRDLMRVCEDSYFWGAKFNWATPGTAGLLKQYNREMKRNGKKQYTLFDPEVKKKFKREEYSKVSGEFKFLPEDAASPGVMDIFGDHIVMFAGAEVGNVGSNLTIFVLINKQLAETYRTWFQSTWNLLPGKSFGGKK